MVMCFVPDCKHYSERRTCRFFRFPKEEKQRKEWIRNIRRADREPLFTSLVCNCHFINKEKKNGPTIFKRNENRYMTFKSPERKKRRLCPEIEGSMPEAEPVESTVDENPYMFIHQSGGQSSAEVPTSVVNAENYFLKEEIINLKSEVERLKKQPFQYQNIKAQEKLVMFYTTLLNDNLFQLVLKLCTKTEISYYLGWKVEVLTFEDQLFLTLLKLRLNLRHQDLAVRFGVSNATVCNVFLTWLHLLHECIFQQLMTMVPTQKKNQMCLPSCFESYQNCRMIIDCTEIDTFIPTRMDHQRLFYSSYKHRNTMKGLVGIAPNGVITFVSDLYPGSTSDRAVVIHSNIVSLFKQGDLILADKGFLISDLVPAGVSVNVPPFLFHPQFTPSEVIETKNIARARVHVERAIRKIKIFSILKVIPKSLFAHATLIWQVCASLTNFQCPLIKEVSDLYHVMD